MMRGQLVSVTRAPAGVEVLSAVAAGALTVPVLSALDVDEDGGALLLLPDGSTVAVASADHEAATVTLADPLPVPLGEGDWLTVPGALEVVATVSVDGEPIEGITVPHKLRALLPDRFEQLGDGVTVLFDVDSAGGLSLTDVLDSPPIEVWGDPDGAAAEMSNDGLSFYMMGPNGRWEATRLGSGRDRLGVFNAEGQAVAGVSADGGLVGQSGVIAGDLSVGGVPLLGRLWDNSPGRSQGWLERFSAGDVATTPFTASRGPFTTATEMGYCKVGFTARAGRSYRVGFTAQVFSGLAGAAVRSRLRYTTGGTEPTVTSTLLSEDTSGAAYSPTTRMTCQTQARLTVPVDTTIVVMYSVEGLGGATPQVGGGIFEIQDMGPQGTYGGGTYTTGREATPPATVREYASTWNATDFRVYDESGQPVPDATEPRQYGVPAGRRDYTAILFDGAATYGSHAGETVTSATTGATITKAEVFLANTSWGGLDSGRIALGKGSLAALPPTLAPQATVHPSVPTGAGAWIEVPASWFSDTNRVVTLGDVDGGIGGGWFMGPDDEFPPQARLTFIS